MRATRNVLIALAVAWSLLDAPIMGLAFLAGAGLFHYGYKQTNN